MKKRKCFPALLGGLLAALLVVCTGCGNPFAVRTDATPAPASTQEKPPQSTSSGEQALSDEEIGELLLQAEAENRMWLCFAGIEGYIPLLRSQEAANGERIDTYLYEGTVHISIERLKPVGINAEELVAYTALREGIDPGEIEPETDDVTGEALTYPAWRLFYKSDGEGSAYWNIDLFVLTDLWNFRLHTTMPLDDDEHVEQVISWIYSVKFEE